MNKKYKKNKSLTYSMKSIFLFLLCTSSTLFSATIKGKAADKKTGDPLIGANVFIEDESNPNAIIGSATDMDGFYVIDNVDEGAYKLKASYLGYEPFELFIEVDNPKKDYIFDIALTTSSIKVDEVVVKDEIRKEKKTEAPASKEIVSSRDIRRSTTTNLGGYLKGLKGVDFTSSGVNNFSLSIRGFNSSFSTRLLMLTDGRVANLPALRVINFSTIPQSSDDVEQIEVVLGPATALYGANAHSGVINIISKPPSKSEGFNASFSGTQDERELIKFNTRYAKKIGALSFKVSAEYVHANEWPFISESEYKLHRYPWSGFNERAIDGKDNNPFKAGEVPITATNDSGQEVWIGNGEPNHGDLDGDGVAGEDWFNGHDDDGDGEIDEDYFYADGIDNQEPLIDCNSDLSICDGDPGWESSMGNGVWDTGEQYEDWNSNGEWDGYSCEDSLGNMIECTTPGSYGIDENIDDGFDVWYDGVDNDGDGEIDDQDEAYSEQRGAANWGYNMENLNIIIKDGRRIKDNILYNEDDWADFDLDGNGTISEDERKISYIGADDDIRGITRYNEDLFKLEFDVFIYDYGSDGVAGDPWIDLGGGDAIYDQGEQLVVGGWNDFGLDGIQDTGDEGEGDNIWQPGDNWVDSNNDGVANYLTDDWSNCSDGDGDGCNLFDIATGIDTAYNENTFNDVWPPPNGVWDTGETILDCGNDGYCWSDAVANNACNGDGSCLAVDVYGNPAADADNNPIYIYGPDAGELDGILIAQDSGEFDGQLDTGDGIYGFAGIDLNGDGDYTDDGETPPDYQDNFEISYDINADGIEDFPDFEVENKKAEIRVDYDPNPDMNLTFQTGYSWTKTQQVTGIGRFLAEGWESTFYQLRGRYKSWFAQAFYNVGNSGKTRNYNIGQVINDQSSNLGLQLQNEFFLPRVNTEVTWGIDYSKTMPKTFGTILNDGPNGYDNDGDNALLQNDGIDNNLDGVIDDDFDGTDEPDEYQKVEANEYGLYFQSKTDILGNEKWNFIAAARLDHHDQLNEPAQFGPKIGINYEPVKGSQWRLTYGLAYNTPTVTTLYTDLYYGKQSIFDVFLRGNKDGSPYARVPEPGEQYFVNGVGYDFNTPENGPGFWTDACGGSTSIQCDPSNPDHFVPNPQYQDVFNTAEDFTDLDGDGTYTEGIDAFYPNSQDLDGDGKWTGGYGDRIIGAPFYFNTQSAGGPADYLPLDTATYYIYVPFADGDGGVSYTPAESHNVVDVEPLGPERMQTLEFGYKGPIGKKTYMAADIYISQFNDFFSPATIITPLVKLRSTGQTVGMLPANTYGSNPPYGTGWDGQDNDNDWSSDTQTAFSNWDNNWKFIENPYNSDGEIINTDGIVMPWEEAFEWDDDKDGDGNPQDPGEWGYVELVYYEGTDEILGYTIHRPEDVLDQSTFSFPGYLQSNENDRKGYIYWTDVGVDEYSSTTGLGEGETIALGIVGSDGEERYGPGRPTSPPNIILSSLNYGNVVHSGIDVSLTHFINQRLIIDGNFAFFNSTDYYNVLTKRFDPINAPKFKFNANIKWDASIDTDLMLSFRYVDKFQWQDGIWSGIIGPYQIVDIHYNKKITQNLTFSISGLNILNDLHKELIGGAKIGRQIILKMTSAF